MTVDLKRLAEPFPAKDIEWRVGQCGKTRDGRAWAKVLAYITNRAIMQRLDDVCGPGCWRNEFKEWTVGGQAGVLCGISILCDENPHGPPDWVTKWDGAENTDIEAIKGGLSGAMKRAAVQWGIGRYLYDLEEGWAVICEKDKEAHHAKTKDGLEFWWKPPPLPTWALPKLHTPPPDDSIQANRLSPAEEDRARQANPKPEPIQWATQDQVDAIASLGKSLGWGQLEWADLLQKHKVKGIRRLTAADAAQLVLDMTRRFELECRRGEVKNLLTELALSLDDVRNEAPSVAADTPDQLDQAQADAALKVLRHAKETANV
jgi:hypothetical protein